MMRLIQGGAPEEPEPKEYRIGEDGKVAVAEDGEVLDLTQWGIQWATPGTWIMIR